MIRNINCTFIMLIWKWVTLKWIFRSDFKANCSGRFLMALLFPLKHLTYSVVLAIVTLPLIKSCYQIKYYKLRIGFIITKCYIYKDCVGWEDVVNRFLVACVVFCMREQFCLECWMTDKVQEPSSSKCNILLSEPFRMTFPKPLNFAGYLSNTSWLSGHLIYCSCLLVLSAFDKSSYLVIYFI